ncbi:RuvB-like Holliday junction ATP-dependent DNA helicase [Saccharolobus shibatae B12]|uniref:RuvB-like Holliday junction ATP-dependent DNA helicase n=1 Tax=Saccharolobus shibatae (strain ATCC 51178 / DSM 5389 / JCM 8931 / NBRC 15437 / B12) TaxID=523848 RepID=A0A8F5BKM9_SACSH|nr:AAA family ATPase [Saccharolobus shibatae]QXJ27093.1 RuvB-like Holliday junction ATP-dependent DNA helicase [Saccharolobus shibatae B12]QXJ29986.1 RuvB-like Holliday junction ATP-dependent DNA helicase [Saccharolobus shibatae B12]
MPEEDKLFNKIMNECKNTGQIVSVFYHDRWFNMIKRAIESFQKGECNKDLLILTGPRRVGKTTILSKLNDEFKKYACYVNIEDSYIRKYISTHSLKDLVVSLHEITGRNIFMLDEITSLEQDWSRAVKELWDYLEKNNLKIFIIITGSAGILISNKYSDIAGRSEHCKSGEHKLSNPLTILPKKFSELLPRKLYKSPYFKSIIPLKKQERLEILIKIARAERSEIEYVNRILKGINIITQKQQKISLSKYMRAVLDDFLLRGGFPQLLQARLSINNPHNDVYGIATNILDSIHKDAILLSLKDVETKKFLLAYKNTAKISALIDITKLENELKRLLNTTNKKSDPNLISKLISFFEDAHILVKADPLIVDEDTKSNTNLKKLFLIDPALFWALYYNDIDFSRYTKELGYSTTIVGFLLEHTVCSHLIRLGRSIQLEFYNDGETDIDCIFELHGNKIFLQVERSENEVQKDLERTANIIQKIKEKDKSGLKNYYPISVVYDLDEIRVYNLPNGQIGVAIPTHYFLSLI